jgi:hypothetical protein
MSVTTKIETTVAIDVGEIDAHGVLARMAQRVCGHRAEEAVTVVKPDAIRGPVVVAHVDVGRAVAVEVPHGNASDPNRVGGDLSGLAVLVEESDQSVQGTAAKWPRPSLR